MALAKWDERNVWDPFREMEGLQREMGRLFDRSLLPPHEWLPAEEKAWWPRVDAAEEKDRIVVRADLPGMKQEDIHVELEDGALTIRGERKKETETQEGKFQRVERSYGSFLRSFDLPAAVDAAKAAAAYKNGVLEITLPKRAGAQPKSLKVEVR